MPEINVCPECGATLGKKTMRCRCGWHEKSKAHPNSNLGCQYQLDGWHCPLPGTVSHSVRNGPWYCRWHASVLDDQRKAFAISQEIKTNSQKFLR